MMKKYSFGAFGFCLTVLCVLFFGVYSASTQTTSEENIDRGVKVYLGELIAPNSAKAYFNSIASNGSFTYPSDATIYRPHEDSRLIELAISLGFDKAEWSGLAASDLTKRKSDYVDAAYEYVKNNIHDQQMFGLHHGAMGAIYHGTGTSFDQADLLVELMKVADIEARYRIGEVTLNSDQVKAQYGSIQPKTVCQILANGGIPATINGMSNCDAISSYSEDPSISVTLIKAWVRINYNGTNYQFDPSMKSYLYFDGGYDFLSQSGITSAGINSAMGGSMASSNNKFVGPNSETLRDYMNARSSALRTAIQDMDMSSLDTIGGRRLIVESGAPRQTSMAGYSANWINASAKVPNELRARVTIDLGLARDNIDENDEHFVEVMLDDRVTIDLARIGADVVVISPIHVTNGGQYSGGLSFFTKETSKFELSILRPGAHGKDIYGDTGSGSGLQNLGATVMETSGDNLITFSAALIDVAYSDWAINMEFDAPYASGQGDHETTKAADKFTATSLIIRSGANERFDGQLYERFIPDKTNLWYGLYINDRNRVEACQNAREHNANYLISGNGVDRYIAGPPSLEGTGLLGCGGRIVGHISTPCLGINCSDVIGSEIEGLGGNTCTVTEMTRIVYTNGYYESSPAVSFASESPCFGTPEDDIGRTTSHDKRLKLKSIVNAQWYRDSTNAIDLVGYLANGRASHSLSLGIVSSAVVHNPDLSFGNDALLIDVETQATFVPSQNSHSLPAVAVTIAGLLSATEGLILQNMTGSPRVDSAVTKNDWYAWNANYNQMTGLHNGPYNPARPDRNGSPTYEGFSPGDSLSQIEAIVGESDFADYISGLVANGRYYIRPARHDLGPVEAYEQEGPDAGSEYEGRSGRSPTYSFMHSSPKSVTIGHFVGVGKKGGTGVKLPEFDTPELDAEELTKDSYEKLYGKFTVNEQTGDFSFSRENELLVGGQSFNQLGFSRNYETTNTNNGPLGQGWSHNHDAKIRLATNLDVAFDAANPKQQIPVIVSVLANLELAEQKLASSDWTAIIQSLLINGWLSHEIFDNEVIITSSSGSDKFYRVADNEFVNVDNPTASLTQTGDVKFYQARRPYVNSTTRQELVEAAANPPPDGGHTYLVGRRYWVTYDQYFDYSDIDFTYVTSSKSTLQFERMPPLTYDGSAIACFPSELLPYESADHNPYKCGKENGSWPLLQATDATGRVIKYNYEIEDGLGLWGNSGTLAQLGSVVDERSGNALIFEYESSSGGILFEVDFSAGLDDPGNPIWQMTARNYQPASYLTHGQWSHLKKVRTNVEGGPEVVFNYVDGEGEARTAPLLKSFNDPTGYRHDYRYVVLPVDQNSVRDQSNLLKSFTAASVDTPIFDLTYSDSGRVVLLTDAEGRLVKHGINGGRNTTTDPLGNQTIRHYDPEGRLIEMIEPSYEDAE